MNAEVKPLQGLEKLKFGTPIDLVRENLGVSYTTFKRAPSAVMPCDFFESLGIFTYYKLSGALEAIEFVSPAKPLYLGVNLLEAEVDEIKKILIERDSDIVDLVRLRDRDSSVAPRKDFAIELGYPGIKRTARQK